eukprot:scaffold66008_cov33-Tisochrysis_lutea.AAC.7
MREGRGGKAIAQGIGRHRPCADWMEGARMHHWPLRHPTCTYPRRRRPGHVFITKKTHLPVRPSRASSPSIFKHGTREGIAAEVTSNNAQSMGGYESTRTPAYKEGEQRESIHMQPHR